MYISVRTHDTRTHMRACMYARFRYVDRPVMRPQLMHASLAMRACMYARSPSYRPT